MCQGGPLGVPGGCLGVPPALDAGQGGVQPTPKALFSFPSLPAGHLERARPAVLRDFEARRESRAGGLTKFCQRGHFRKCLFMLRIGSTSSRIFLWKRYILYCDLALSYFVSNYRKIKRVIDNIPVTQPPVINSLNTPFYITQKL